MIRWRERSGVDPKAFWNAKIVDWETTRYGGAAVRGVLENAAGRISSSVRFRLDLAARLLAPHVPGRRMVEVGCGSGLLAERLIALGAASYAGYDISEVAIERANTRIAQASGGGAIRFAVAGVEDLPPQGDALVLSLGLVDWLPPDQIGRLFAIGRDGSCLHSCSERRFSPAQIVHRAYVQVSYGWNSGGYRPQYHRVTELAALARRYGVADLHVFRHPRLRFGAFVSDLTLVAPDGSR